MTLGVFTAGLYVKQRLSLSVVVNLVGWLEVGKSLSQVMFSSCCQQLFNLLSRRSHSITMDELLVATLLPVASCIYAALVNMYKNYNSFVAGVSSIWGGESSSGFSSYGVPLWNGLQWLYWSGMETLCAVLAEQATQSTIQSLIITLIRTCISVKSMYS